MERLIANLLQSYKTSLLDEKRRRKAEILAHASTAGALKSGRTNLALWENERKYLFELIKFWGAKRIENAFDLGTNVSPDGEESLKEEISTFIASEFGRIRNEFKDFLRAGMMLNPAFDSIADKTSSELMVASKREAEIVTDSIKKQYIKGEEVKVQGAPLLNKDNMDSSYSWNTISEEFGITKCLFRSIPTPHSGMIPNPDSGVTRPPVPG